jgi:hypothetical protein
MRQKLEITTGAKLSVICILILVLFMGAGNLWATYDQVHSSNRQIKKVVQSDNRKIRALIIHDDREWCGVLTTLDEANQHSPTPQSKYGRTLVRDFHVLRIQHGCG